MRRYVDDLHNPNPLMEYRIARSNRGMKHRSIIPPSSRPQVNIIVERTINDQSSLPADRRCVVGIDGVMEPVERRVD
jgi:hypothetical protein